MGAGASSDGASEKFLTKEEVVVLAGSQWDEAKWEPLEKDEEGRVKLETLLSLAAPESSAAQATPAQEPTEGVEMGAEGTAAPAAEEPAKKKFTSMRDRHQYRFPEFHEEHKEDLEHITVAHEVTNEADAEAPAPLRRAISAIEVEESPNEKAELVFIKLAQKLAKDHDASSQSTGFGTRYRPATINYYKMFKEMDIAGNDRLDKDEFKEVLRRVLKVSAEEISDQELSDVFDAMDGDGNGSVSLREFAAFEHGAQETAVYRAERMYHSGNSPHPGSYIGKSVDGAEAEKLMYYAKGDNPEDLTSVPELSDISTREGSMAADRVANAPKDLSQAHLVLWHLAQHIGAKSDKEQTGGIVYHPSHQSFGRMFKQLDIDQSGSITRDEWAIVLRKHIGVGTNITDDDLNSIFDCMDFSGGGSVTLSEFSAWARGASPAAQARGLAYHHYSKKSLAEMAAAQEKTLSG